MSFEWVLRCYPTGYETITNTEMIQKLRDIVISDLTKIYKRVANIASFPLFFFFFYGGSLMDVASQTT